MAGEPGVGGGRGVVAYLLWECGLSRFSIEVSSARSRFAPSSAVRRTTHMRDGMNQSRDRGNLERNLQRLSRTLHLGTIDSASSPEKVGALDPALEDPSRTRMIAETNVATALDFVESQLRQSRVHSDVGSIVVEVNTILTRGIVVAGALYRTHEPVTGIPYIPASEVPQYAAKTFHIFRHSRALPVPLAAFSIWAIDLRGHLFSDGCGKTALIVSSYLLRREGCHVPLIPSRSGYYSGPYGEDGNMSWPKWLRYYSSLSVN